MARKFAGALRDPQFQVTSSEAYLNAYGVMGWRVNGVCRGRTFYASQSQTTEPDSPEKFAKILSNGDNVDVRKLAVYRNEKMQDGLRVEAWFGGRWFQVFTPDDSTQPNDEFRQLLIKICIERQRHLNDFGGLLRFLKLSV